MFQRGDVYYANLGNPPGSIQRGVRPVVILCNSKACRYAPVLSVVPLTTTPKKIPVHVELQVGGKKSTALPEQLTTLSVGQLLDQIDHLSDRDIWKISMAVKKQLGLR